MGGMWVGPRREHGGGARGEQGGGIREDAVPSPTPSFLSLVVR